MLALAVFGFLLACLVVILFGFYKIKPAQIKLWAEVWKVKLGFEIKSHEQRSLSGNARDDQRPDL